MKEAEVDMASQEPLAPWVPQGLSKLGGPFPGLRVTSTAGLWGNHSKHRPSATRGTLYNSRLHNNLA